MLIYVFFLKILSQSFVGVGGEHGWGVVGENVSKQLGRIISAYEELLGKLTDDTQK